MTLALDSVSQGLDVVLTECECKLHNRMLMLKIFSLEVPVLKGHFLMG